MFRKLMFSGLAVLALGAPLAITSQAKAGESLTEPVSYDHRLAYYEVRARGPGHPFWEVYATFHSRENARHVAERLRHEGYEVWVVRR